MSKSELNDGGFVPYEQYNPPFVTEDMNVTMTMLKHHIMPDGADIDALADAMVEALKRKEKGNMSKNNCDYLVRDGICGAYLKVFCVYQTRHKYPHNDPHWSEIHSFKECWCDYPNIAVPPDVEKAIRDIAEFVNGKKTIHTTINHQ